jgi:hypothetical protein
LSKNSCHKIPDHKPETEVISVSGFFHYDFTFTDNSAFPKADARVIIKQIQSGSSITVAM